jgi:hypothetical protein
MKRLKRIQIKNASALHRRTFRIEALKAGQAKKQLNRDLLTSLEKIKIETKIEKNAVSNVLILKPLTLNLLKIKRHCSVLKRQLKLSATPLKVSDLILVNNESN